MRGISYILSRVWLDIRFLRDGGNHLTIREIVDGKMAAGIKMPLSAAGADVDDDGVHGELRL